MTVAEQELLAPPASAKELRACVETGTAAYILVDPMLGEPLPDIRYAKNADIESVQLAREQVWCRPIFMIMLDRKVPLEPAQYPYLVGMDGGRHDGWLEATLEIAREARAASTVDGLMGTGGAPMPIGGWLMSGMCAAELTDALAKLFRLDTEAATPARYLRLPDPRVFEWTQRVVGKARLSAALGRVQRWHTIDALGRLTTLASLGEEALPLRFNRAEWHKMGRGEDVHPAIAMAIGAATCAAEPVPCEPYERVMFALDLADAAAKHWPQRFNQPRDRQLWAALCLLHGDPMSWNAVRELLDTPSEEGELPEPVRFLAVTLAATMRGRGATDTTKQSTRHSMEPRQ